MRTLVTLAITLAAGVVASSALAGDYYRWKDDSGVVHYDPKPPKDHPSTLVHISGKLPEPAPAEAAPADASKADGAKPASAVGPDSSEKAKAAMAAINEDNCRIVTANIGHYEGSGAVTSKNPDGSLHTMTPEEREAGYKEALRQRDEFCGKK